MKTVLFASLLILLVSGGFAATPLTRDRLLNSLDVEEQRSLIDDINAMRVDDHKMSVALVIREMNEELASGREYNNGRVIMGLLPQIADDATLVASVGSYLSSANVKLREAALDYLSKGTGPMVGAVLAKRIDVVFRSLPDPSAPIPQADENATVHVEDLGVSFLRCVEGLLRSKSTSYRDLGANYLERFKRRYEVSPQGREVIREITECIDREVGPSIQEGRIDSVEKDTNLSMRSEIKHVTASYAGTVRPVVSRSFNWRKLVFISLIVIFVVLGCLWLFNLRDRDG